MHKKKHENLILLIHRTIPFPFYFIECFKFCSWKWMILFPRGILALFIYDNSASQPQQPVLIILPHGGHNLFTLRVHSCGLHIWLYNQKN